MADRSPPAEAVDDGRVWASQWYRTRPETFEYFELFFEADRVSAVYGDESFKSVLLRRDGREREARERGERYATEPTEDLLGNERSFAVATSDLTRVRVSEGSLLLKPKLEIETDEKIRAFYHHSRSHDVTPLYDLLDDLYTDVEVDVVLRERGWLL